MTLDEMNRTIHEARVDEQGKKRCWHEFEKTGPYVEYNCDAEYTCKVCHGHYGGERPYTVDRDERDNPNYTTNKSEYLSALLEFKERWSKIDVDAEGVWSKWSEFIAYCLPDDGGEENPSVVIKKMTAMFEDPNIPSVLLDPKLGVPILAEYLRGRG